MKLSDIKIGVEAAVGARGYQPNRVRAVEIVAVNPPRGGSRWIGARTHVLLPGELDHSAANAEKRVRVEAARGRILYLGDPDAQGRRWLPARLFVSTWAAWKASQVAEDARQTQKAALREAHRTAWAPIIERAKARGIVPQWETPPTGEGISLALSRETLLRVLDALDVIERAP